MPLDAWARLLRHGCATRGVKPPDWNRSTALTPWAGCWRKISSPACGGAAAGQQRHGRLRRAGGWTCRAPVPVAHVAAHCCGAGGRDAQPGNVLASSPVRQCLRALMPWSCKNTPKRLVQVRFVSMSPFARGRTFAVRVRHSSGPDGVVLPGAPDASWHWVWPLRWAQRKCRWYRRASAWRC